MGDFKVDFAIITAIELERQAVCRAFGMDDGDRVSRGSRIYWQKSLDLKEGEFYNIVVAQCPDMAGVSAALLVADIVVHWHPQAVLLVGIAAGVDQEKQNLGDLVIGSDVYYYDRCKLAPDGKRLEPIMYRADHTLWEHIQKASAWIPPDTLSRPDKTQIHPKIHYGVIASGEKVIADAIVRDEITAGHRKIIAIEMEGYGFSAAIWQSPEQIRSLVIKSICDFADTEKGDIWQPYAAAVAAEFTKHFLLDKPLPPLNPPKLDPGDPRYSFIIDGLKSGNLVPFLGQGINSSFYIDLALDLAKFVREDLLSGSGENDSKNEKLIQTLIGIPCSVCHYWPQDRPPECPMLKNINGTEDIKTCPLYIEQGLAVSKINLRYLSQYYILKNSLEMLYGKLYEILEVLETTHQPSELHHFLAELPHLMAAHNYPRRSPGLPFQLIVTTNYDDMLEKAFVAAQQPFDVVFYIADGDDQGKFKHQPYMGEPQIIEKDDSEHLPLRAPWGTSSQPRPIILKLFGTWEAAWNNNFVATEQQMSYLISTLKDNLPTGLLNALTKGNVLFMGYSPSDSDLLLLMNCLWPNNKIPSKSWLLHQAKPGDLEKELWKTRNVELRELPSSIDGSVVQFRDVIKARIQ